MNRPFVFLNMASSIDGKITTAGRENFSLGSQGDRHRMEELRARADAVLIGAGTLRDEDPPLLIRDPELVAGRVARGAPAQPVNVLVSTLLDVPIAGSRFFNAEQTRRIVFTTPAAPRKKLREAAARAKVVLVPRDPHGRVHPGAMLERMPRLGIEQLLLEGGGGLNFAMLEADLIDEIHLTLCPSVIGGSAAPTTFEGAGFTRRGMRSLKLDGVRSNDLGELFLKYTVLRQERPTEAARAAESAVVD